MSLNWKEMENHNMLTVFLHNCKQINASIYILRNNASTFRGQLQNNWTIFVTLRYVKMNLDLAGSD